jgi:hypothetical protein
MYQCPELMDFNLAGGPVFAFTTVAPKVASKLEPPMERGDLTGKKRPTHCS